MSQINRKLRRQQKAALRHDHHFHEVLTRWPDKCFGYTRHVLSDLKVLRDLEIKGIKITPPDTVSFRPIHRALVIRYGQMGTGRYKKEIGLQDHKGFEKAYDQCEAETWKSTAEDYNPLSIHETGLFWQRYHFWKTDLRTYIVVLRNLYFLTYSDICRGVVINTQNGTLKTEETGVDLRHKLEEVGLI